MTNSVSTDQFKPVRIGRLGKRVIAGIDRRHDATTVHAIPAQWGSVSALAGQHDCFVSGGAYGVCHTTSPDGSFGYMAGMQLEKGADAPAGLDSVTVPAGNYAKFACPVHVSMIRQQWDRIMGEWLPGSGYEITDGASVEFYGPSFDGMTGEGGFELWVPVRKQA